MTMPEVCWACHQKLDAIERHGAAEAELAALKERIEVWTRRTRMPDEPLSLTELLALLEPEG